MRRSRIKLGAAALTVVALALTGCGVKSGRSASSAADTKCPWTPDKSIKTSAKIGYQKIPNGDLVVKDLRLLEECMPNAKITWSNFASGGDVVQAYGNKNTVDIALLGSSGTTIAVSPPLSLPVSVVWIHDVIGAAESLVVRDKSIKSIKQLKGKTIAVPYGSTSHFSLLQAVQDAGMDPAKDIKLINLEPEKMPSAWQGKQIDAAWVWDPVLSQLKKTGTVILGSQDTAKAGKPTFDLGTARKDFVKANPDFMAQWAKAEDYAVKMINDDPDKASVSIGVELGMKPAEAKSLFPGYTYLSAAQQAGPQYLGGKMAQDLLITGKFLLSQGSIDKVGSPQEYAGAVDKTPAQDAGQ